jgi:hypothetical protein
MSFLLGRWVRNNLDCVTQHYCRYSSGANGPDSGACLEYRVTAHRDRPKASKGRFVCTEQQIDCVESFLSDEIPTFPLPDPISSQFQSREQKRRGSHHACLIALSTRARDAGEL